MAFQYSPKIITNGLVLSLDAANKKSYVGSGTTWADLSGNSNNGILTNGPTFDSGNGGNIVFDGVNDEVSTTYEIGITSNTPRTLELWCYISSTQKKNIMGYGAASTSNQFDTILWYDSGYYRVIGHYYGSGYDTLSTLPLRNTININSWNQIIHTYNGTDVSIYTNGVFSNSKTLSLDTSDSVLYFGRGIFGSYNYSSSKIAKVSVYNRALTSDEILQNYNALKSRFGS